jgi:hypothetical protein
MRPPLPCGSPCSPRVRAAGFEVIEQCTYARGAITTWRMWREPTRSHDPWIAPQSPSQVPQLSGDFGGRIVRIPCVSGFF